MNKKIIVNQTAMTVKEYRGQRVVTLKDIDTVHQRPEGTASRNFRANKEHFIEEVDFFTVELTDDEIRRQFGVSKNAGRTLTLVTEPGYLMVVKSFTDDLAWQVQRELINGYFRAKEMVPDFTNLSPQLQCLINLERKQQEHDKAIAAVNKQLEDIRDVVTLNPNSWREDTRRLISKIATAQGGFDHIRDVNAEIYNLVDARGKVSLATRLTNKRRRMADEGVCESKRKKLTKVDVIADDPKLIEIYSAVVKDMAVKNGVGLN